MFNKTPFILLAVIALTLCLAPLVPVEAKQFLYSVSLLIKSIIIALLPVIIFGLLFKATMNMAGNATRIALLILVGIVTSNFLTTFLSHYVGAWIYSFDLSIILPKDLDELKPLWKLALPSLISNDKAMFAGVILGICANYFKVDTKFALKLESLISKLLNSIVFLIPLFIVGFIVKLQHEGMIKLIIRDYAQIFIIVGLTQLTYVTIIYTLVNRGKIKEALRCIKNMIPAAISGFSTMSSAASMPLTIVGVSKNVKNKDLARSIIPATVNIHLLGDCIAIPIFAYAVLKNYGMAEPNIANYLIFTFYFVLAKFSVAAIPGGGIIVMLPILEAHLGFNAEMMSLITALYLLFDPVITCTNILGNGAFAKMMDNLTSR